MTALLLVIIYIAFISLGLPDSILGSAWPILHQSLGVPVSYAGILTVIGSGGTIVSSFFSGKLIRRFGTGRLTALSVFMTAAALIGYGFAPGFILLCVLSIPLGLGAGAVDAALNNFVALHYKAKHMNWLHCFWGVGATAGPIMMSFFIARENGWRMGYGAIGVFQLALALCLVVSLPLWRGMDSEVQTQSDAEKTDAKLAGLIGVPGAKPAFMGFFCYCGVEAVTGVWGSSYLVIHRGVPADNAAKWISLYYLGITVGRFLCGFLTFKVNNRNMIRLGQIVCLCGTALVCLPLGGPAPMLGLPLIGLGCAPIYPAMLHETPNRFGAEASQGIMGMQMAVAYVGATALPPVVGFLANAVGFWIWPFVLVLLAVAMLAFSENVNAAVRRRHENWEM